MLLCVRRLPSNIEVLHIAVRNGINATSDLFQMNVGIGSRLHHLVGDLMMRQRYINCQTRVKTQKLHCSCCFYLCWRIARSDSVNLVLEELEERVGSVHSVIS